MLRHPRVAFPCVLLLSLPLAGCVRDPGGIAPSNIPVSQNGYSELGRVQAQDCMVRLLGILPVSGGNQTADAVSRALAQKPGADALVNITVDRVSKYFILWSQTCTEVRARAVRFRSP